MKEKGMISAAITGSIHTPSMTPHLPVTPKRIADEAVEAGAVIERGETGPAGTFVGKKERCGR